MVQKRVENNKINRTVAMLKKILTSIFKIAFLAEFFAGEILIFLLSFQDFIGKLKVAIF